MFFGNSRHCKIENQRRDGDCRSDLKGLYSLERTAVKVDVKNNDRRTIENSKQSDTGTRDTPGRS